MQPLEIPNNSTETSNIAGAEKPSKKQEFIQRLKEIKNPETRKKIYKRLTLGILAPLSVLAMNTQKAEAAPDMPTQFSPEVQQLVDGMETRVVNGGHVFSVPGVKGEITASHVVEGGEGIEGYEHVEGTTDISVEKGFDTSQITNWSMPAGEVLDAKLVTKGNGTTGFGSEKMEIDCKMIGISYQDMWGDEDGVAQLVVCLKDGVGYDIVKGNSGSGMILENGVIAVTSQHNYPLFGGEKNDANFDRAIDKVQEIYGVDRAQATDLVDGGGFFEVFGSIANQGGGDVESKDGINKDIFGTLTDSELEQGDVNHDKSVENEDSYLF